MFTRHAFDTPPQVDAAAPRYAVILMPMRRALHAARCRAMLPVDDAAMLIRRRCHAIRRFRFRCLMIRDIDALFDAFTPLSADAFYAMPMFLRFFFAPYDAAILAPLPC